MRPSSARGHTPSRTGTAHALYRYAWFLAHRSLATHLVGVGEIDPEGLMTAHPSLEVVGVLPPGSSLPAGPGRWMRWEEAADLPILPDPPGRSILLCLGLSWIDSPDAVLHRLGAWSAQATALIVTARPSDRLAGSPEGLDAALEDAGLRPGFLGWTGDGSQRVPVAVVAPSLAPQLPMGGAPDTFRVVAIMTSYNEEDIMGASLDRLIDQGIDVYVIDNWSTDGTYDAAARRLGRGVIGIERYPPGAPSSHYRWEALLRRVEEVAGTLDADWLLHHDVDEVRMAPWPGVGLRDAIHVVDRLGFTALDHSVLVFPPTDDSFVPGTDFAVHFRLFDFAPARDFLQIKAWKHGGSGASLVHGGHDVRFPGRRIYPFKFLLRHYPIRSQAHGERKVFGERRERFKNWERLRGWHSQYEVLRPGGSFLRSAAELHEWDEATFVRDHLLEALCGAASDGGMPALMGSLPALLPGGYDVRWSRKRGSDGIGYESIEYDRGDVTYRQGTGDLASRESAILSTLDGGPFPRPLSVRATPEYSMAIVQRLEAPTVRAQAADIAADRDSFYRFASRCLALLADLRRASVEHRNISESSVLVGPAGPALSDFAWARSPSVRRLDFDSLADLPPDGASSDVYALGRLLARISAGKFPAFDAVVALMTEPDPSLRVTDVALLEALFTAALDEPSETT
jgi:hypothetical protein